MHLNVPPANVPSTDTSLVNDIITKYPAIQVFGFVTTVTMAILYMVITLFLLLFFFFEQSNFDIMRTLGKCTFCLTHTSPLGM